MTKSSPQERIVEIIDRAKTKARPHSIDSLFIDRPFYNEVCRAHAVSPDTAPNGVRIKGMVIKPMDVLAAT